MMLIAQSVAIFLVLFFTNTTHPMTRNTDTRTATSQLAETEQALQELYEKLENQVVLLNHLKKNLSDLLIIVEELVKTSPPAHNTASSNTTTIIDDNTIVDNNQPEEHQTTSEQLAIPSLAVQKTLIAHFGSIVATGIFNGARSYTLCKLSQNFVYESLWNFSCTLACKQEPTLIATLLSKNNKALIGFILKKLIDIYQKKEFTAKAVTQEFLDNLVSINSGFIATYIFHYYCYQYFMGNSEN